MENDLLVSYNWLKDQYVGFVDNAKELYSEEIKMPIGLNKKRENLIEASENLKMAKMTAESLANSNRAKDDGKSDQWLVMADNCQVLIEKIAEEKESIEKSPWFLISKVP